MNKILIKDNHIKNKNFLKQLQKESLWNKFPKFNWWDGWWKSKPKNPLEKFIEYSWKEYSLCKQMAGFEYWTNDYSNNRGLDWHNDKDEGIFQTTGEIVKPEIGSVFWVTVKNIKGGYLDLKEPNGFTRIDPIENRFLIFNAGNFHRVTPVTEGFRRTFLINLWKEKPKTFKDSNHVSINCIPIKFKYS